MPGVRFTNLRASRDSGWGIVKLSFNRIDKSAVGMNNPSVSLTASHLPLHKGGLGLAWIAASHLLLLGGGLDLVRIAASHLLLLGGGLDLVRIASRQILLLGGGLGLNAPF